MPRLSSADLLNLWERGCDCHPVDRALLALGAAFPQCPYEELADLPVGRRDAALLRMRCELFGTRLEAYTDCPGCGAQLEFALDGDSLVQDPPYADAQATLTVAGTRFRLPTSRDLARIADISDEETAARQLLELCRVSGGEDGAAPGFTSMDKQLAEVESRMAEADPAANTEFAFVCEVCKHQWEQPFDIGEFLWEEITARARRLLRDVHLLARSYAWSEREVLALSDARREAYLAMVRT